MPQPDPQGAEDAFAARLADAAFLEKHGHMTVQEFLLAELEKHEERIRQRAEDNIRTFREAAAEGRRTLLEGVTDAR